MTITGYWHNMGRKVPASYWHSLARGIRALKSNGINHHTFVVLFQHSVPDVVIHEGGSSCETGWWLRHVQKSTILWLPWSAIVQPYMFWKNFSSDCDDGYDCCDGYDGDDVDDGVDGMMVTQWGMQGRMGMQHPLEMQCRIRDTELSKSPQWKTRYNKWYNEPANLQWGIMRDHTFTCTTALAYCASFSSVFNFWQQ